MFWLVLDVVFGSFVKIHKFDLSSKLCSDNDFTGKKVKDERLGGFEPPRR
jgi:hypothetical protein